jgi:hypothetical protein
MSGARQFSLKWHNSASRFLSANSSLPMQVHKRLANTVSAQPRSKMSLFRPSLDACDGGDRRPHHVDDRAWPGRDVGYARVAGQVSRPH